MLSIVHKSLHLIDKAFQFILTTCSGYKGTFLWQYLGLHSGFCVTIGYPHSSTKRMGGE